MTAERPIIHPLPYHPLPYEAGAGEHGHEGLPSMETEFTPSRDSRLSGMANAELLALWSSIMDELRGRGVIRSSNNPTADYAEYVAAEHLGVRLVDNSTAGYDATSLDGTRFQIKGRRLTDHNRSRQLSALRKLNTDCFDELVIVVFGPGFDLQELWRLPIDLVRDHAKYRQHVNGHILHAQGAVLSDPRAVRLI